MRKKTYLVFLLVFLAVLGRAVPSYAYVAEQEGEFFSEAVSAGASGQREDLINEIQELAEKGDFQSAAVLLRALEEISPGDAEAARLSRIIQEGLSRQKDALDCRDSAFILSYRNYIDYQLNRCNLQAAKGLYGRLYAKCRRFSPAVLREIRLQISRKRRACIRKEINNRRRGRQKQKQAEALIKQGRFSEAAGVLEEACKYLAAGVCTRLRAQIEEGRREKERRSLEEKFNQARKEVQQGSYKKARADIDAALKSARYNRDYARQRAQEILKALSLRQAEEKAAQKRKIVEAALHKAETLLQAREELRQGKVGEAKALLEQLKASYPGDSRILSLEKRISQKEKEFSLVLEGVSGLLDKGYYLPAAKMLSSLENDYAGFTAAYKDKIDALWFRVLVLRRKKKLALVEQLNLLIQRGDYQKAEGILSRLQRDWGGDKETEKLISRIQQLIEAEAEKKKQLAAVKKLHNVLQGAGYVQKEEVEDLIKKVERSHEPAEKR